MSHEKDSVFICGPEKEKYDMVFLVGPDDPLNYKTLELAKNSGLSCCVIGKGKEDFLTKHQIEAELKGKIDHNTKMLIIGHGSAEKTKGERYGQHTIDIYPPDENQKTLRLVKDLDKIFRSDSSNRSKRMCVDVISCQAGALRIYERKITASLHCNQEYSTLAINGLEIINDLIESRRHKKNWPDTYHGVMRRIVECPETVIFSENGERFRASAPKQPLDKDLERYLRNSLREFLEFRRDRLGHRIQNIDERVRNFKISPETLRKYKEQALYIELDKDNYIYAKKCLAQNPELAKTRTILGSSILHVACNNYNKKYLNLFLNSGAADINTTNRYGESALDYSCRNGLFFHAALLLTHGADISVGLYGTFTPLMTAASCGRKDIVELLLRKIDDVSLLTQRCDGEKAEQFCCERGIEIPEADRNLFGKTAAEMAEKMPEIAAMIEARIAELRSREVIGPATARIFARRHDPYAATPIVRAP